VTICTNALTNNGSFTFTYNGKSCSRLLTERTLLTRCLYEFADDTTPVSDCLSLINADLKVHSTSTDITTATLIVANDATVLASPTNWIPLCYKHSQSSVCTSLVSTLYTLCTTNSSNTNVISSPACQDLFKT